MRFTSPLREVGERERAGWGHVSVPGLTLTRSGFALATSPAAWER